MLEEYYQSIKATLYDRVSSPLWGAFSISWVAWNYRMLVVLFSSMNPDEKFSFIAKYLYPDWCAYALYWLGAPFLTAAIIIGVVPAVGELAYRVSRFWKVRLKKAKLEFDSQTPMAQDEVNQILLNAAEEKRKLEERIVIAVKERNDAQSRLEENIVDTNKLQAQLSNSESALEDVTKEIEELKLARDIGELIGVSGKQLRHQLVNGNFELLFNAAQKRAKRITFNEDGYIGEGRNENEERWEIDSGDLVIYTAKDELQNRFRYERDTGGFVAADDGQVKALPNQSIKPITV